MHASQQLHLIPYCYGGSWPAAALQRHLPTPHPSSSGVAVQGDRRAAELRGLSLLGVTQIDRVVEAVEETLKGHTVQLLAKKALPRLDLPKVRGGWRRGMAGRQVPACPRRQRWSMQGAGAARGVACTGRAVRTAGKASATGELAPAGWQAPVIYADGAWPGRACNSGWVASRCRPFVTLPPLAQVRRNRHIEILPLSTGCLGACTYCKTKHARGQLGSYDPAELVARAAAAAADPQVLRAAGRTAVGAQSSRCLAAAGQHLARSRWL